MRLLITLTPQWQISREIEMTHILLLYSEYEKKGGGKGLSNAKLENHKLSYHC